MPELSEILVAERKSDFSSFEVPPQKVTLGVRLLTLVAIIVPLLGVMAAPFFVWGWGFGWTDLGLLLGMYTVSALGITIGFHRLFVHRSFETYVWIKFLWAIFGSMAIQGALFQWVGMHRRHHKFSDRPEDPHTPHHHGKGFLGLLKGFWHAHIGWFFNADPADFEHYIKDLKNIRSLRIANDLFPLWVALSLILPAVLGGIISSSWMGAWTGFIWRRLVRIFLVHHITWSVNSACHLWGMQPYHSDDESRNNIFFGILAMGEGWHNTHHAFPTSVRHGLSWWQIDTSYWVIRMMAFLGLAWNLKLPSKEAQRKERRITAKS